MTNLMSDAVMTITANDIAGIIESRAEVEDGYLGNAGYIAHEIYLTMLAASPSVGGWGSSADADTHRAAEGAVLVLKEIIPAVEAYLMTGDVMSRSLKEQTWGPAIKRALAAVEKATTGAEPYSVGTKRSEVNQETILPQTEKGS